MAAFDSGRVIDDVSWHLLCALQENARMSFAELGRRVGLTAPAVAERVRRMEDAGIIAGYRLALNVDRVGRPVSAIVRIAIDDVEKCRRFVAFAQSCPAILECHHVTGVDSYVLKVAVPSVRHLSDFLDQMRSWGQSATSVILASPVTQRVIHAPDRDGEST